MRQVPVGEPAATAALNCVTPRWRSSLKRLRPFPHCRQRYDRNLRRTHASRFVSTSRGLAEPEVATPSDEVRCQLFDNPRQTDPACPAGLLPDSRLECVECLRRDAPLAPVIRDAKPEELPLLRPRHRTLRLVDLQPQLGGQEPAHRRHDTFTGAMAADINVASSSGGESHPSALTEPDMRTLASSGSYTPASGRTPSCHRTNRLGSRRAMHPSQCTDARSRRLNRLNSLAYPVYTDTHQG